MFPADKLTNLHITCWQTRYSRSQLPTPATSLLYGARKFSILFI